MATQLLLSGILGIVCFKLAFCQETALVPYSLIEISRKDNLVTLSCEGSGALETPGAVFFRNGVHEDSDPCLQMAAVNKDVGVLELNVTASCEGRFMCGITQPGGRYILSGPKLVLAYPKLIPGTPTSALPMVAVEGESVVLPCDVERSFLDQFTVTWFKSTSDISELIPVMTEANFDYSLTLNELEISSSGIYRCTVTANANFLTDASLRTIPGRAIDLTIRNRHIPVYFISDLSYEVDGSGRMLFSVSARGTQSLSFWWFVDDELVSDRVKSTTTAESGSEVIVQSELELEKLPVSTSTLQVLASNMDPFTGQEFMVNQSALLVPNNQQPPPVPSPFIVPSTSGSNLEGKPECSLTEKVLIGFFSAASVVIVVLVVLLIVLLLFVKYHHSCGKKSTSYDKDFDDKHIELKPPSHDYPANTVVTAVDSTALAHFPQYDSPMANVLANVAFVIRDKVETNQDLAVLTAINHILLEVLNHTDISPDLVKCIEQLIADINRISSKIRARRRYKRNMSRMSALTPGSTLSPTSSPLVNNFLTKKHPLSIAPSTEEAEKPLQASLPQQASQSEDMVDGPVISGQHEEDEDTDDESDSEESNKIKITKDISDKLHQWLLRHKSSIVLENSGDRLANV